MKRDEATVGLQEGFGEHGQDDNITSQFVCPTCHGRMFEAEVESYRLSNG